MNFNKLLLISIEPIKIIIFYIKVINKRIDKRIHDKEEEFENTR